MGKEAKQIYENWRQRGSILGDAVRDLKALEVFAGVRLRPRNCWGQLQAPTVRGSQADARYHRIFCAP